MTVPAGLHRLAPAVAWPDPGRAPELWVCPVLEDGTVEDLTWLFSTLPLATVRAVFRTDGGRLLSHRSRCLWSRVLAVESPAPHPRAAALWPLQAP